MFVCVWDRRKKIVVLTLSWSDLVGDQEAVAVLLNVTCEDKKSDDGGVGVDADDQMVNWIHSYVLFIE